MRSTPHPYFARLVCLFTCKVDGKEHPLALIQPYAVNPTTGLSRVQKDMVIDLELHRLRENFRGECEFISIHTIIHGAVLV